MAVLGLDNALSVIAYHQTIYLRCLSLLCAIAITFDGQSGITRPFYALTKLFLWVVHLCMGSGYADGTDMFSGPSGLCAAHSKNKFEILQDQHTI